MAENSDDSQYDIEEINFTGFIAQEVDQAAQNIDFDFGGIDTSGEVMGLRYSSFVAPLTKAIQEQTEIINDQQSQINELTSQLEELKKQMEILVGDK